MAKVTRDNNPRIALKDEVDWKPRRARRQLRIAVVGAGVAGLEAAWIAAARGHAVTVFGSSPEVGGSTRLHSLLPGGESLSSVYDFQYQQARRFGVAFELGVRATVDDLQAIAPDRIVLASGATMLWPRALPESWREDGMLLDARSAARELHALRERQGGTAVLFDMDHTEGTYGVAELLMRLYDRVVVVTPREAIATDVPLVTRLGINRRFARLGIEMLPFAEIAEECAFEDARIAYRNVHTGRVGLIDGVVFAAYSTPRAPCDELLAPLRTLNIPVDLIGDAKLSRTLLAATAEGHAVGIDL